ncbi:L-rhamnose/proton symporter RhaT [Sphingobacterium tabacisoli]|uniref:L-rhamnose/proton symporter RhaT n=1 Tax=Sphingobacterium tabacisoli TaxID=2044855 RepID=A0ABW5L1L0_9SPHI|nr:L-rhamnose/proton symporter RhaT [Sphingobacterium tabacisoli]
MNAIFGVLFHFIGGFASGSFYVPYKRVKGWSWEAMWILGGLFSWIIVPPIAAWLTIPDFCDIIKDADSSTIGFTFLFGVLWGIGGLTFGLGIRYLGVSLGSSVMLGLSMVFGALMPAVYYYFKVVPGKQGLDYFFTTDAGLCIIGGLILCIIGVVLCGRAGILKERSLKTKQVENKSEYNFGIGITVAIISGILSACFNFAIEAGKPMAEVANLLWKQNHADQGEFLFQNNVSYIIILWGGFTSNFVWCLFLLFKNRSYQDYTNFKTPISKNMLLCAIAGTTWYLQFFFYGMGESRLGNGASSWILHMAFIILISNAWGVFLKEWKGVSRPTYLAILSGIVLIVVSICVIGFAKTLT